VCGLSTAGIFHRVLMDTVLCLLLGTVRVRFCSLAWDTVDGERGAVEGGGEWVARVSYWNSLSLWVSTTGTGPGLIDSRIKMVGTSMGKV